MATCFVIQPFDRGAFDKRYDSVIAPAIREAGLEPYRVDRDPSASIPIETIESEIRNSRVCVADISLNNPNVWYEVGFATANNREVILICSEDRPDGKFPFDVQHRHVISYKIGSPQDFDDLKLKITERIKAILKKDGVLMKLQEPDVLAGVSGLQAHELAAIAAICESMNAVGEGCSSYSLLREMDNFGFTRAATNISVKMLMIKGFITSEAASDRDGDTYYIYHLTDGGWNWIIANSTKFNFSATKAKPTTARRQSTLDEDIPF